MKRLTEKERIEAAIREAQANNCGAWWTTAKCLKPRGFGDHLCRGHREEFAQRTAHVGEEIAC